MATAPEKLATLRHLLAERFPRTSRAAGSSTVLPSTLLRAGRTARVLPTGIPLLDNATGGLPLGAITEIVCTAPSCGSHLFFGQLLAATRATRTRIALVDGTDSFDPASFPAEHLAHLVWARCRTIADALHAADLFARDANLGLVALDLRRAPEADLRRIPDRQWYRLQRAVEPADLSLLVETPRASVPSAQLRLVLTSSHKLALLQSARSSLTAQLAPNLQRQRMPAAAAG